MMTNDTDGLITLTDRVDALERENRRLKGGGAVLLAVVIALSAMGAGAVESLNAQKLTVTDPTGSVTISGSDIIMKSPNGTERLFVGLSDKDHPVMNFYGPEGKTRVSLIGSDLPFLRLLDAKNEREYMGLTTDNHPVIRMYGSDGTERAFLGVSTQNDPNLLLYGSNGKLRAALTATDLPYFTMYDALNNARINVQVSDSNVAKMWLEDTSGSTTWRAP
jgi:hypothetical protein